MKYIKYIPVYAVIGFINFTDILSYINENYTVRAILLVGGAIAIDLILGIRKAKKAGIFEGTTGVGQTVDKCIRYLSFILLGGIVDALLEPVKIGIPWGVMITGLALTAMEVWSWFEKAEKKEQKKIRTIVSIVKNNKELAEELLTALKEIEENGNKN